MANQRSIGIAIVGCGFVADYYMTTLVDYPHLRIMGVYDNDASRLTAFCEYHKVAKYPNMDELLGDTRVLIVLNLTNPRSHYEVTRRCLLGGRNVYSEKPLAMSYEEAEQLVQLAEANGLVLSGAPCNLLGSSAQTLWRALREQIVGKVRLVYAELDDGLVHAMPYRKWYSASGAPWPYKDEFEVGCTLEHAGYYVTWLAALFGPVVSVTAHAECLVPDKLAHEALDPIDSADCSFGILKFASGVVARLSTTIIAPHDRSIRIFGDEGVLEVKDCWFNDSLIRRRKIISIRRKRFLSPITTTFKVPGRSRARPRRTGGSRMDFAAGVAELAAALVGGRQSRLSAKFTLHVTEVALALQNARGGAIYLTRSRFDPIEPAEWASLR